MSLGRAPAQADAFRSTRAFCEPRLSPTSVYRLLHDEGHRLFPDDMFADLFTSRGRNCVPPRVVAIVMVLQRVEGLSDREAVDRFEFDARWKYAAGGLDFEHDGFVHTVLVDMRARLRKSERPDRIFEVVLDVARSAGLVGRKRVLDSTALYDAVATQDTVTMIRSSIRGLLRVAGDALSAELRATLKREDDYASAGKPACDWDDKGAREALVDALARDAHAALGVLHEREVSTEVKKAAMLVATVVGQDLDEGEDGVFRIALRVAPDRVISTVDPEARHGHKTSARGFDGYKGHVAIDPDSEIITSTAVTAANESDASVAKKLLEDVLPLPATPSIEGTTAHASMENPSAQGSTEPAASEPAALQPGLQSTESLPAQESTVAHPSTERTAAHPGMEGMASEPAELSGTTTQASTESPNAHAATEAPPSAQPSTESTAEETSRELAPAQAHSLQPVEVYGDASYGTGDILEYLEGRATPNVKVQPASAAAGLFSKDVFEVDLEHNTVKCPADVLVQIRPAGTSRIAEFGSNCASCRLRDQCTKSKAGRTIRLNEHERHLRRERARQKDPAWQANYKATRPKVERKQAHMMRRRHGGRRARVRGRLRVGQDFSLLAAATNLQRLAVLRARW